MLTEHVYDFAYRWLASAVWLLSDLGNNKLTAFCFFSSFRDQNILIDPRIVWRNKADPLLPVVPTNNLRVRTLQDFDDTTKRTITVIQACNTDKYAIPMQNISGVSVGQKYISTILFWANKRETIWMAQHTAND